MIRISKNVRYTERFLREVAGAMKVAPVQELLDGTTVKLWSDPEFDPNDQTEEAEFDAVECAFTDYVAKALTPSDAVQLTADLIGVDGTVTWNLTTDPTAVGETARGYWLANANGVQMFEKFAEGQEVALTQVGDQLLLVVRVPLPIAIDMP